MIPARDLIDYHLCFALTRKSTTDSVFSFYGRSRSAFHLLALSPLPAPIRTNTSFFVF
jgi:hypothetical protein